MAYLRYTKEQDLNTQLIAVIIMVAIGAAYLIFLSVTWQQLQLDRSRAMSKIDAMLDRMPKPVVQEPLPDVGS